MFVYGYAAHAGQLVQLLSTQHGDRTLDVLINTHFHSDPCGGNSLFAEQLFRFADLGAFNAIYEGACDEDALTFQWTGL